MANLLFSLATLGPVGRLPAPGTAGSAVAVLVGAVILQFGWSVLLAACILVSFIGIKSADIYEARTGKKDAGEVIIDEVAGQWLVMLVIPASATGGAFMLWLLASFAFFRLFDILKPWPVSAAEKWPGGLGVMADDILAGLMAAVVLLIWQL